MSQEAFPMSEPNPQEGNSQQGLGSRIHAHFASHGGVELETYEADEERERQQESAT
jgi:hypothetical protein